MRSSGREACCHSHFVTHILKPAHPAVAVLTSSGRGYRHNRTPYPCKFHRNQLVGHPGRPRGDVMQLLLLQFEPSTSTWALGSDRCRSLFRQCEGPPGRGNGGASSTQTMPNTIVASGTVWDGVPTTADKADDFPPRDNRWKVLFLSPFVLCAGTIEARSCLLDSKIYCE